MGHGRNHADSADGALVMALSWKIFGSGLNGLTVKSAFNDVADSLTATGTNQATAYAMTAADNEFTTVASGTGAILYAGAAGDTQYVYNGGANPLMVYPPSGSKINSLTTNMGVSIPVATGCIFKMLTSTRWIGILSR